MRVCIVVLLLLCALLRLPLLPAHYSIAPSSRSSKSQTREKWSEGYWMLGVRFLPICSPAGNSKQFTICKLKRNLRMLRARTVRATNLQLIGGVEHIVDCMTLLAVLTYLPCRVWWLALYRLRYPLINILPITFVLGKLLLLLQLLLSISL